MKMKFKRLSVLLLALLIAVMPLSVAVPVNASVLDDGGSYYEPDLESADFTFRFYAPYALKSFYIVACPIDLNDPWGYADIYLISTDAFYISAFDVEFFPSQLVNLSIRARQSLDFYYIPFDVRVFHIRESLESVSDFGFGSFRFGSSYDEFSFPADGTFEMHFDNALGAFNFGGSEIISQTVKLRYVQSGPSILQTFSGVGSWFSSAVNNMIPMFWTAEGGLTVIGVLAVCSLALAVILLFLWLIAGWLKFK